MQTERTFTTAEGLKERPWFKHQIYAPGAYTGYGVKTIPAVREMMEEDKWQDADAGAVIAGAVLMKQAAWWTPSPRSWSRWLATHLRQRRRRGSIEGGRGAGQREVTRERGEIRQGRLSVRKFS